ncbi:MAG: RNA polymerase sigma factor [Armatimonadota bacterium]
MGHHGEPRRGVGRACPGGCDIDSFALLVERHQRWVLNLAYQLVGSADEAEDVAQDVFVVAYQKLGQLRRRANFRAWLRKITVHQALRRRRKLSRTGPLEVEVSDENARAGNQTAVAVHEVLHSMPDHLAAVLILRELHSLSYQEIAEALDTPVGTVRSRLHAARECFRRLWEAER